MSKSNANTVSLPSNAVRLELVCKPLTFRNRAKNAARVYAFRDDTVELFAIGINASLKAQPDITLPVVHSFGTADVGSKEVQGAIARLTSEGFGIDYIDANTIRIIPPVGKKADISK